MFLPVVLVALTGVQDIAPPPRALTREDLVARSETDAKAAREAFAAGRYREALDLYTLWKPAHWCGTGRICLQSERQHGIIRCHIFLHDHATAARLCLDALAKRGESCGREAAILFELYHDAGQADDLRRMLGALEAVALDNFLKSTRLIPEQGRECVKYFDTATLRDYFRIADLGAEDEIEQLVAVIESAQVRGSPNTGTGELTRNRLAAETLARCGDDAAHLIFLTLIEYPKNPSWLIYALGKSKSPKALGYLEELVRVRWRDQTILQALAMKGEAGQKVLRRIAADEKHPLRADAAEWLKGMPAVPQPPKPKVGSMPKTFR